MQGIWLMLEEACHSSSERRFLSLCSTGARLNSRKAGSVRRYGESTEQWIDRTQEVLEVVASRDGCFDVPSCINCPKGQRLLQDSMARHSPFWDYRHVDAALKTLSAHGPERHLPDVCEIGRKINDLLDLQEALETDLRPSITQLEGQFACTKTVSCMHCELGMGLFRAMLLDLAQHGLDGEYGTFLREQHAYL